MDGGVIVADLPCFILAGPVARRLHSFAVVDSLWNYSFTDLYFIKIQFYSPLIIYLTLDLKQF